MYLSPKITEIPLVHISMLLKNCKISNEIMTLIFLKMNDFVEILFTDFTCKIKKT